jgi:hypothetical protein
MDCQSAFLLHCYITHACVGKCPVNEGCLVACLDKSQNHMGVCMRKLRARLLGKSQTSCASKEDSQTMDTGISPSSTDYWNQVQDDGVTLTPTDHTFEHSASLVCNVLSIESTEQGQRRIVQRCARTQRSQRPDEGKCEYGMGRVDGDRDGEMERAREDGEGEMERAREKSRERAHVGA